MKVDRGAVIQLAALFVVALNLRTPLASIGPVIETIRAEFGLSHPAVSLLMALPVLCMGVFAQSAGALHTRLGARRAVTWMLLSLAAGTLLRTVHAWSALLSSTVLIGAVIAVLGPLLGIFIKQHFPTRAAMATGVMSAGLCLGAAAAAGFTAPLSLAWSWQWALAAWAIPAVLAAFVWRQIVPAQAPASVQVVSEATPNPWKIPRAWLLLSVFALQSTVFYVALAWLAPAYMQFGVSHATAGALLGTMTLAQLAGPLAIGIFARRQGDRRPWLMLCGALTLIGCIAVAWAPLAFPWLWMSILGAGSAGLFTLTMTLPLDYGPTPEAAGKWTAMMLTGSYLFSAFGPYAAGVLRDVSGRYDWVFAALAVMLGLLLLLCLFLKPPSRPFSAPT